MINEEQVWAEIAILRRRAIQHSVSPWYSPQPLDVAWDNLLANRTPEAARQAYDVALRCYKKRRYNEQRHHREFSVDDKRSLRALADAAQIIAWLLESEDEIRQTPGYQPPGHRPSPP